MNNENLLSEYLRKYILIGICFMCLFVLQITSCYAEQDYDGYLVKFKTPIITSQSLSDENRLEPIYEDENIYALTNETNSFLEYLASDEDVEILEPNYIITLPDMVYDIDSAASYPSTDTILSRNSIPYGFDTPNDPLYSSQWNLKMINTPSVWTRNINTNKVRIGVIDSGDPSRHPDITQNINTGFDSTGTDPYDTYGHSTSVISIISANINNNIGIAGILPNCTVYPIKAFEGKTTSYQKIIDGLKAAIETYDCDVINLSIASDSNSSTVESIIKSEIENGRIFVSSAGNNGTASIAYPAGIDGVIGVGSVTRSKGRASHSQFNETVDVAAPGESVYTARMTVSKTQYTYGFGMTSGTSFAAPHVTAAAAIAKSYKPDMDSDEFLELLSKTSEHLGEDGKNDKFGYGLLNIENIITTLESSTNPNPTETPAPEPTEIPINQDVIVTGFTPTINHATNTAKVRVSLKNIGENKKIRAFLSSYSFTNEDGTEILTDVDSIPEKSLLAGSSVTFMSNTINLDNSGMAYLKLLVWDEYMRPLSNPYLYEIKY